MHYINIFGIISKNIMEKFDEFHLLTTVFTGNPLIYITTLERYSRYYFTITQAVNVHDDSTLWVNSQYSASHFPFMRWWNIIQHVWTGVSTPAVTFMPRYADRQISIKAKNTFSDYEHTHSGITPKVLGVHFLSKNTLPFSSLIYFYVLTVL
jgi:hypothetical protein